MKNIKTLILGLAAAAALGTSCNVLDLDPTDRYSPATVWASEKSVDQYIIGLYSTFKVNTDIEGSQAQFTDAHSDIIKSSSWDSYNHSFNKAALEPASFTNQNAGVFECWSSDYQRIRRQNEFLRDAPNYRSKFSDTFINSRMAEIRFCRAYTYMHLIRVYGGVVLRTNVDGPAQNNKARATEAESWDLVLSDLKFAAENLPKKGSNTNNGEWGGGTEGRADKAAAYGLLSRAALYAKQWDLVVAAADKAKEFGGKLLLGADAYKAVFDDTSLEQNDEMLFAVRYKASDLSNNHDMYFCPNNDSQQALAAFAPTSELVDSYEMNNTEGYKGDFSWEKYASDPYSNREPRFYATILYNGATWKDRTLEIYAGGADAPRDFEMANAAKATTTGYYFCKYLASDAKNAWIGSGSGHFFPICRYAEVLLNKAEALAQQDYGKNKIEALAALNEVRSRVGLPARDAGDLEAFMTYLRRERMVELAGEGFRYWDLRRWKLSVNILNDKAMHGVRAKKNSDNTFTYEQVEVDAGKTRIFLEKYYAFSIPISERSSNPSLGNNNLGW